MLTETVHEALLSCTTVGDDESESSGGGLPPRPLRGDPDLELEREREREARASAGAPPTSSIARKAEVASILHSTQLH